MLSATLTDSINFRSYYESSLFYFYSFYSRSISR